MNIKIDNLGEFLKSKRKENNLTIRCVACSTNLSPGYISRLENNSSVPSYETLVNLSKILLFNINDVIDTDIKIDTNKTFDILEVLSVYNLKYKDVELSDKDKYAIRNIIKLIYKTDWENETEKLSGIFKFLDIVKDIKINNK